MGRDESQVQIQDMFDGLEGVAGLGTEELQAQVDASEDGAAAMYRCLRALSPVVTDAVRRAEALTRLDVALRLAGAR